MKTRKIKAQEAELDYEVQTRDANGQLIHQIRSTKNWTLPRTPKTYDRMVEQIKEEMWTESGMTRMECARLATISFRALGITRPKEEKK